VIPLNTPIGPASRPAPPAKGVGEILVENEAA